jgi:hypothetical protein
MGGQVNTNRERGYTNLKGSIPSVVSASQDAGFSIVRYTGTGANATVGHGLSSAPEVILTKNREDSENWVVGHEYVASDPWTDYLRLNTTLGVNDSVNMWNDTAPTATVFTVGSHNTTNGTDDDMIAYCFHSVDGFSKVGSYISTNTEDGPFVYTGFRPSWVMIKRDGTSDWQILDTKRNLFNPMNEVLEPNQNLSTQTSTSSADFFADFLSNGFKLRGNGSHANGGTAALYVYLAFAEQPFKYSNAR